MALSSRQEDRRHNRQLAVPMHTPGEVEMPIDRLSNVGTGDEWAHEMIKSELLLDGQPRLNLATFVTTWMPTLGAALMAETADKNMMDKDEYPQTAEIEARCATSWPTCGALPSTSM